MPSLTLRSFTIRTLVAACVLCLTVVSVGSAQDEDGDDLKERAKAMIQKAQQLAEKGRVNEAEELERGAHKLLESAKQLERKHAGKSERGEAEKKQSDQKQKVRKGDADGRDDFNSAPSSGKSTERKLDPREHKPEHPERNELEKAAQRLQHVRIAAENLKAAGLPDLARAAAQRAEEMEHQLREAHAQHEREARRGGRDERDEVIENLRREVQQLREELKAIRARLEK